jgi:hypothetical protein
MSLRTSAQARRYTQKKYDGSEKGQKGQIVIMPDERKAEGFELRGPHS